MNFPIELFSALVTTAALIFLLAMLVWSFCWIGPVFWRKCVAVRARMIPARIAIFIAGIASGLVVGVTVARLLSHRYGFTNAAEGFYQLRYDYLTGKTWQRCIPRNESWSLVAEPDNTPIDFLPETIQSSNRLQGVEWLPETNRPGPFDDLIPKPVQTLKP